MLSVRTESLPDRIRLALEVTRDSFQSAVRTWLDEGNALTELALFFEYREGGFLRVKPAHRDTLAEYASEEVAAELRRARGAEGANGVTPLFFKPHMAEIASGRVVWVTVAVDE